MSVVAAAYPTPCLPHRMGAHRDEDTVGTLRVAVCALGRAGAGGRETRSERNSAERGTAIWGESGLHLLWLFDWFAFSPLSRFC